VTITSGADDSAATFTVTGTDKDGNALTESITGSSGAPGTATGAQFFKTITSIKSSAVPAGTIETGVGTAIVGGPKELAGTDIGAGSAEAALALLTLKSTVDTMNITAGNLYNKVSNIMSHMGSLDAGYQLDVASKMDVNFAGETTELAKGQILAQAGTAMLAQANAQGQGMLALLQT
jgi:flagellin